MGRHGTWAHRNDMRMVRWMCNASLRDRNSSDELRSLRRIKDVIRIRRLNWLGHLERMEEDNRDFRKPFRAQRQREAAKESQFIRTLVSSPTTTQLKKVSAEETNHELEI
ncbi:uncharacterized protein LOC130644720 [Hydractinia symbiolongicarpus]|uniref:uncharacterized protein LOC130644720 n=1 Tax=Hydractinia symbiolongicarpus TaxID=13093 RepID=UPI002549FD6A|nr:uncharacterized protein LOC130644720 [Hydractinia symbiolongicarpus]